MAKLRQFLLSFTLLGLIVFIQFSSYRWETSEEERINQLQQEMRKQLMQEQCDGDKQAFWKEKHSLENLTDKDLQHFIVDDTHRIIYCYIPKVACTNWKRVMFALKQGEPYPDPMSIDPDSVHLPNRFPLLKAFPRTDMKMKLKNYTKFLFVRDPFVRLISAYRDKFLKNNSYYYENYGRDILHRYGNHPDTPRTGKEAFKLGIRPSFYNFIQYLLDPQTERTEPFEPHWRQTYRLCHPCLIQYNFIGHQETFQEDAQELLKMLKLEEKIKIPPVYMNVTSPDSVLDWFSSVPLEDRRTLYKLYKEDFRLFGYRRPDEILDG